MFRTETIGGVELLRCRPLQKAGVPHGFTSRRAGFGARDNASEDHDVLARALGVRKLATMRQVHGRVVRDAETLTASAECDGVVTGRPDLGLVVHTADCVPLLVWAADVNAVSAVHAGWRGTLARVAEAAVRALVDRGARPPSLHVAMGPSIRECCFEVGDEVVDAFVREGRDRERISRPGPNQRRHVDLVDDNRLQLVGAGVPPEQIYDSGCCTVCESETFYSYRREGKGVGRLMGAIAVRSSTPRRAP